VINFGVGIGADIDIRGSFLGGKTGKEQKSKQSEHKFFH